MDKNKYLDTFMLFITGMIEKNKNKLNDSMSNNACLYHMTGLKESKEEYIKDILNGTLNYYDYEIIKFDIEKVIIRLLAKVYNSNKTWWTLIIYTKYIEENNRIKLLESKVKLG